MDYLQIGTGVFAAYGGLSLLRNIVKVTKQKINKNVDNIGKIYLFGQIKGYEPSRTPLRKNQFITPSGVEELVEEAIDEGIKGLIFEIDSPGGSVVPSKEIADYIKKIDIPTVALVRSIAASGAYWVASSCDHIVSNEFSMIGGIGVIMAHLEISGLAEKYGVKYDGIKSGEYKDMGNLFRPFTDEEEKILQEDSDEVHSGFISTIAQNRGLDEDQVKSLANGLVYHGSKAQKLGLVDMLGNTDEAVKYIEEIGNFEHDTIIDYEEKSKGLASFLGLNLNAYDIGRQVAHGFVESVQSNVTGIRWR